MSIRFPNKKVTVIMPAYKAEKTLAQTIAAIPKDCVDEIILVDDASPDKTVAVAKELGIDVVIRHPKNRGYGGNQKTCYQTALARGADIVVMVHPDYQYDPIFIPHLVEPIARGAADAVFGSRMIEPRNALRGGMPYWKFVANVGLTLIENVILGLHLSEYHSGFRAYSRKALLTVPFSQCHDDFVFDSEIIVQMRIADLKIAETPISTRYFPEASTISFMRSCRYGFAILWLLGQYIVSRLHLYTFLKFTMLTDRTTPCPLCASEAPQLDYVPEAKGGAAKAYTISEHSHGLSQTLYHCQVCDHVFTTDRTDPTELEQLYTDQGVDAAYIAEEKGRRATARRILRQLAELVPHQGTLVDVGSGYGFFLDEAQKAGWQVRGIELGSASVTHARTYGLTIAQASWHVLTDTPDASIDVITAFDVIEHLDDPKGFVALVTKKLVPGGYLVLTNPRYSSFFARVTGKRWHAFLPSHLHYFTDASMRFVLTEQSLTTKVSRHYWRYFSLGYIFSRASDYGIGRLLRKICTPLLSIVVPISVFDEFELYAKKSTSSPGQSGGVWRRGSATK